MTQHWRSPPCQGISPNLMQHPMSGLQYPEQTQAPMTYQELKPRPRRVTVECADH